jgi:hypothetical protein
VFVLRTSTNLQESIPVKNVMSYAKGALGSLRKSAQSVVRVISFYKTPMSVRQNVQ